jgi:hypothetical protein
MPRRWKSSLLGFLTTLALLAFVLCVPVMIGGVVLAIGELVLYPVTAEGVGFQRASRTNAAAVRRHETRNYQPETAPTVRS